MSTLVLLSSRFTKGIYLRYRISIPSGTASPSIDLEKWQIARAALQTCRSLE